MNSTSTQAAALRFIADAYRQAWDSVGEPVSKRVDVQGVVRRWGVSVEALRAIGALAREAGYHANMASTIGALPVAERPAYAAKLAREAVTALRAALKGA